MNLLIVEDDKNFQSLLKQAFAEKKVKVTQAADGQQAIELIAKCKFNVIILDMHLPGHNAVEVVNEIRSFPDTINLPIYIYSTYASQLEGAKVSQLFVYDKSKTTPKQLAKIITEAHANN